MHRAFFVATLVALSLLSTSVLVAADTYPELKLSVDYAFFDSIKEFVVRPAIATYLLKKPFNQTIQLNSSAMLYSYYANFSDPTITDLTLDWPSSHFLTAGPNNGSVIQIRGLNVTLSANYSIVANSIFSSQGNCNVTLTGASVNITVQPSKNPDGTNYYLSIPNATFDWTSIDLSFPTTVTSTIGWIAKQIINSYSGSIKSTVTNLLTQNVSETLKSKTINGIAIPYGIFNITATLPVSPVVYSGDSGNYTNIGLDINIVNNQTGETAPTFFGDNIADERVSGGQVEVLIASNLLNQVGWAVHQMGLIKAALSNKQLPADAPISLNTTALRILLPQLADEFGAGKGVYVAVKPANQAPQFYTRDGRFIGTVATSIEFWVDKDGSRYPDEGLDNCTTCAKGVVFNNTLLLEVNLFSLNASSLGVTVLNVDMVDLNIISGEGYDATKLRASLNNVVAGLVPGINAKLKAGIAIPLIGFLGIKDVSLYVNKNYLDLEVSLKTATNQARRI